MIRKILPAMLSLLFLVCLVSAQDKQPQAREKASASRDVVSGRIEQVTPNSMAVRVGDATTTYTFDDKTVFTYGTQPATANDLRIGEQVFVNGRKGKAEKVHVTQQIQGVIESIDFVGEKLRLKIDDKHTEIPFAYFWVTTVEGRRSSVGNMKPGDLVMLNINLGLPPKSAAKANEKKRQ